MRVKNGRCQENHFPSEITTRLFLVVEEVEVEEVEEGEEEAFVPDDSRG